MSYLERKQKWLDSSLVTEGEKEYIRNASDETLKEMFGAPVHFGTAGMRALLGPGCGRLNTLTVRRATIGVAHFLLKKYGPNAARKRGFAISFDNRHCSKKFRDTAAKVLTDMGFTVYTFRDPHPTPELSYTVRHLNCVGGIMITASHNPKEYNGYKFYDEKGCQGVYEIIDGVIAEINALDDELSVTYESVSDDEKGKITYLDDDPAYDEKFIEVEASTSLFLDRYQGEKLTKIVFSPECGADCKVAPMLFKKLGYTCVTVPNQDFFDPDFKGTPNPNPETEEAYFGAFETLTNLNKEGKKFNLILVADPDADRCGIAFLNKDGKIQRFNGNQTGALLIDFLLGTLQRRNELPSKPVVCNTFVTGSQGAVAARMHGAEVRTTATGFKYIGNMADKLRANGENYLFGYEESYGYLIADFVRDKDSLQSFVAISDMVEYYLRQGKTLDVAYEELSEKTGKYYNDQVSIMFPGSDSLTRMAAEIEKLRDNPPSKIGDKEVDTLYDYQLRVITDFVHGGHTSKLNDEDIDFNDCLRFNLKDGGFIAIRPSGTEPKVKIYFEIFGLEDDKAKELVNSLSEEIKKIMGLN